MIDYEFFINALSSCEKTNNTVAKEQISQEEFVYRFAKVAYKEDVYLLTKAFLDYCFECGIIGYTGE